MPQIKQIKHETPQTGPLRVAAYCRVSSDSADQLHSYAAQIQYYTEYIGQHPDWILADIYADEGLTGTKTEKRDDLMRLIADSRKGKIDRVIVKAVARFARNTYDCLSLARELKSYGVSIYFEEQNLDTADMSDEMFLAMNGVQAQEESITISNNMRWHYRERMEKGEFVGTKSAYGYTLVNGTLEIYEPEAVTIRRIFDMYLSGMGKQAIANVLNAEVIPRRHGKDKWYTDTVNYILNNERYIGDALLQKKYTTEFPFRKVINNGELPQYYVENNHPAIISRETFEAAQRVQSGRRRGDYSKTRHILTGIMICPDCGHTFRRQIINGTAYWVCSDQASGRAKCKIYRYPEESVYDAFLLLVNKLAAKREYILMPLISQLERMQDRNSNTQSKVYEIDRQIAEMNQQLHSLAKHRTKGIIDTAEYTARSSVMNKSISTLRTERRKLLTEDETDEMIDELRGLNNIISLTDVQTVFDERLFEKTVTGIIAVSNTEICFRLPGGLELTETISRTERRKAI